MGQDVTVGVDGRPVVQFTEEQAFQALPIKEKVKFNNHKKESSQERRCKAKP